MQVYLVGGAIRDELLGISHQEKDWVVVGATVEEMLAQGYRPVGKDFPVFLHPETHEEYALARIERKVGKGYTGFAFDAAPSVTLEEDLMRRDLTINAIAKTPDGVLIDPYHGQEDIKNKILRHVSPAFAEDPVRILRVGRFLARFAYLGFMVADETYKLMKQMVDAGEVDALVPERVWKEWERALSEKNPEKFFEVLNACDAKKKLFPFELDLAALEKAAQKTSEDDPKPMVRFAVLLNKLSESQAQELCSRYRVPGDYRDLALLTIQFKDKYLKVNQLEVEAMLDSVKSVDVFRREKRFHDLMLACWIINNVDVRDQWGEILEAVKAVKIETIGLSGLQIAKKFTQERIQAIRKLKNK